LAGSLRVIEPDGDVESSASRKRARHAYIIGHHKITKGVDHWLKSPKRKEIFGALGVTNIRTFVDPRRPRPTMAMESKEGTGVSRHHGRVVEAYDAVSLALAFMCRCSRARSSVSRPSGPGTPR
jgi:hypothetical protein